MLLTNIKNLILEMAFERDHAENKITELALPVLNHIIKIFKYEDEYNNLKHINDIDNWLFNIQRILIKPRNKRFKPEQYFKFLFEEQIKSPIDITNYINRELRKYKSLKQLNSDEEVYEELVKLYKKISIDISNDHFEGVENYFENQ
jgi:CRISPR/Cas system-associated protein Csm6